MDASGKTQTNREGRMSPTGENTTTKQARSPVGKRTRLQLRERP